VLVIGARALVEDTGKAGGEEEEVLTFPKKEIERR